MKVKTIDIQAREWFDKVNGNSYFSATVTVNYGMKSEKTIDVPFQYGYGDHYKHQCMKALADGGFIPKQENAFDYAPHMFTQKTGIIIRCAKQTNCKKRELINA
jgi:hypothetical protein